ncbi:MAG: A/G-specific adenine glycosylase [Acidobacteriota bacterium]|nr:A/G-specific adenine glycosylase [Acidobacteriota bacterium]
MAKRGGEQQDIMPEEEILPLRRALLAWYRQNRRDLPWRKDHDAYRVWVSEIMLQQTRVAAVLEHYRLFLEAFPSIEVLAADEESQVLARWSGLGYYRRARLLHKAARTVMRELGGNIPENAAGLRRLEGVGRYTAAAIASIACGEAVAVVDGNVERVLARLDGRPREGEAVWQRAQELLDPRHAGDWNQAMMELGAMVCTPRAPQCLACPVHEWCRAPGADTSRAQEERKRVRMARALVTNAGRVYLAQREAGASKMAGMWELPELASGAERDGEVLCTLRHSITDTDYEVHIVALPLRLLKAAEKRGGRWVDVANLAKLPLTGLTRKALRRQGLLA